MASARKVLLCKGKAGMGNRLLSVLGSILYAELSGRELIVDWSDRAYSRDRSNSFPCFFAAPEAAGGGLLPEPDSVYPPCWKGRLHQTVDEVMSAYEADPEADSNPDIYPRYAIDFARIDYPEDVLVRWSYTHEVQRLRRHCTGELLHLKKMSQTEILRSLIRRKLVLRGDIRRRIDDFRHRYFSDVSIGVHIRHTDRKNSFGHYPLLIDWILRRHPGASIFLATDNRCVEEQLKARYKTRLASTQKWYPEPGRPLHRGRGRHDELEAGAQCLVDMYLLGSANYLIYNSTSTFAVMAHLLADERVRAIDTSLPTVRSSIRGISEWLGGCDLAGTLRRPLRTVMATFGAASR